MEIVPSRCACTDRAGIHWLLWFLWCMLIIKVSITTVRSWCKNLRSLSSKMDALTCNMQESSIGFYRFAILMTRSPALLVLASIVSWSSTAWKMLMLVSCRWIQASTLTRFLSLARLIKSLCMLMQRWLASFCTLSSTPCLSSATLWAVLLSTYQKQRRHSSPMLRWCCQCVILLASRNDSSRDVAMPHIFGEFLALLAATGQTTRIISTVPWLTICSSTMRPFHGVLPSHRLLLWALLKPSLWRWPVAVVKSYERVSLL